MNKEDFQQLLLSKEEEITEAMEDWQKDTLVNKFIEKGNTCDVVLIYETDLPPDREFSIEQLAGYLAEEGLTVITFFANEMSASPKSFSVEV